MRKEDKSFRIERWQSFLRERNSDLFLPLPTFEQLHSFEVFISSR